MENIEGQQVVDITIRKVFDMKMKQGHEMKKVVVDETEFLKTFYFLKGSKVYVIDITTKKIEELEFTRGKEVMFLSSNMNSEYLIIVLKNGSIYAIDNNHNIKHIKNLLVNSLLFETKKENSKGKDKDSSGLNFDNLKMFTSNNINKLVIANENFITIWYQSDLIPSGTVVNYNSKNVIKKSSIEELTGTFYNISLENEKKLLTQENLTKVSHFENIAAMFGNNYFLGSFSRIVYVMLIPTEIPNLFKVYLINYLFRFENGATKYKAIDDSQNKNVFVQNNEFVKNIEKKSIYSYINYSTENSKENLAFTASKQRILIKFNTCGTCCAIMLNCQHAINSTLMIYMAETSKFSMYNMIDLYMKVKPPRTEANKKFLWIEDMGWICNDMFLVLVLSQGYFVMLNINFQLINFIDTSHCVVNAGSGHELLSCPSFVFNQKLKFSDKLNLLTSKKRTDYFIIYDANYSICFQANNKSYECRLLTLSSENETFDDFLYIMKYFQIYYNENDSVGLFDKIHNYMVKCLKELYNPEAEYNMQSENVSHIFSIFVKFIRIFRSINQIHETNLTILSYLIGVSNDFFYHLINFKEIWLAFLFIDICENYLLKHLRLKISRNKLNEDQMVKNQISYIALNPYHQQNPSLKCYNKILNKVLHSRLRLLLLFFALIEFRNNQALNINVLYFVLAKLCLDKLKKHNLLDDIQLIVKVIIRNWKYLKNENSRAGSEEYILNGLNMNYRTEILSQFISSRIPREDIKLDFLSDFLPLDGLQEFNELHETYCRGEEESLVNEYNYINNIGIIQRWTLFFTNYFYNFLFEDIRNYMTNHLKQTMNIKKEAEQISPEETNLSSLIYFNLNFFLLTLNNHLNFFLRFMSSKTDNSNELSFISDNTKILSDFDKLFMPFLSPVDVPFIIFEFYSIEDNKFKKNLPYELNNDLNNLIINYLKCYNFSVNDTLDFLEFLILNGFKNYSEIENFGGGSIDPNNNEEHSENEVRINKMQKYIYSAFIFYLFVIHKLNQLHCLETEVDLIIAVIDNMHLDLKTECYELLFVILNGNLKYFLNKEASGKLSENNSKYLEIVLNFIKVIYYKILREDPFYLKRNIYQFVHASSLVMKSYLLEGALFYEYKNLNKYIKAKLLNSNNLLNINNFLTNSSKKLPNIFEELTRETKNPIFDNIFNDLSVDEGSMFYQNFGYCMKNIILLTKVHSTSNDKSIPKLVFSLESNTDYIRRIITNGLSEKTKERYDDRTSLELVQCIIDKIVKGNFDNKVLFKFSNMELKNKLVKSIKLAIIKYLHLFNIIFVKFRAFYSLNPHKDTLQYVKLISYCLLFGGENSNKDDLQTCSKILDYLLYFNYREIKESDKNVFMEIIKNIHILFVKLRKNPAAYPKMVDLEEKMKVNKDLQVRMKNLVQEEIPKIESVFDNLMFLKSNNLRSLLILCFSDSYWDNMMHVFSHLESYAISQNTKTPLRNAKKRYIKLSESFFELTGIPVKNCIDFTRNWELIQEETLFNFIVNDESEESTNEADKNGNLVMNRRQKSGADTPRKSNLKVYLPNCDKMNNYVNPTPINLNASFSNNLNTSIDLREESDNPSNFKNKPNQIKIKGNKKKANLPKYRAEVKNKLLSSEERLEDGQSTVTIINKNSLDIKIEDHDDVSLNTIVNKQDIKIEDHCEDEFESLKKNNCELFSTKITKVFFHRFKSNVFYKYKVQMNRKELEEIKIYSIKPKENSVEVIVLKEKYVPNKEIEQKSNNMNSSYFSESRKITERTQKNASNFSLAKDINTSNIQDCSINEGNLNLKPFDIININKYRTGKADKSEIYKNLVGSNNKKAIQSTIKSKIEEIQEKLKKYEEMAMSLGKEFNSAFNK